MGDGDDSESCLNGGGWDSHDDGEVGGGAVVASDGSGEVVVAEMAEEK